MYIYIIRYLYESTYGAWSPHNLMTISSSLKTPRLLEVTLRKALMSLMSLSSPRRLNWLNQQKRLSSTKT